MHYFSGVQWACPCMGHTGVAKQEDTMFYCFCVNYGALFLPYPSDLPYPSNPLFNNNKNSIFGSAFALLINVYWHWHQHHSHRHQSAHSWWCLHLHSLLLLPIVFPIRRTNETRLDEPECRACWPSQDTFPAIRKSWITALLIKSYIILAAKYLSSFLNVWTEEL